MQRVCCNMHIIMGYNNWLCSCGSVETRLWEYRQHFCVFWWAWWWPSCQQQCHISPSLHLWKHEQLHECGSDCCYLWWGGASSLCGAAATDMPTTHCNTGSWKMVIDLLFHKSWKSTVLCREVFLFRVLSLILACTIIILCSPWYAPPPDTCSNQTVDGIVISAIAVSSGNDSIVQKLDTSALLEPVRITFQHQTTRGENPTCAFLNEQRVQLAAETWLTERCRVVEEESSSVHTVCECYHLTSFALLLSPTGTVVCMACTNKITLHQQFSFRYFPDW